MLSRLFVSALLALPVCAQAPPAAPAVRIVLQADPPPAGTPALDTAPIAKALGDFANQQGFTAPAADGDGWVLGVQLKPQSGTKGLLCVEATLRLVPMEKGKLVKGEVQGSSLLTEAAASEPLTSALARTLTQQAQVMLNEAKVPPSRGSAKDPLVSQKNLETPGQVRTPAKILSFGPRPPYPAMAKAIQAKGLVIVIVDVGIDGKPRAVTALTGPKSLLKYAMDYSYFGWRFEPCKVNGNPVEGIFRLDMNLDSTQPTMD